MLFSERNIWTMVHGILFGGGALLALSAALFALFLMRGEGARSAAAGQASRSIALLTTLNAMLLWCTTFVGTYVVFPPYRVTPPEGTTDLSAYPRALVLSVPSTEWLHRFGMETKEHLPFIAAMLTTTVAFTAWHYRQRMLTDEGLRRLATTLLMISFVIVAYVSLLGVFVNKVAPLE